jgi:transcriptional regulator with XRE-family HTH domain
VSQITDADLKGAFGDAVRKHRTARGLSQERLAELADIHRTYIGDVERGLRNLALVNMYRIAAALKISLADLVHEMEKAFVTRGTPK